MPIEQPPYGSIRVNKDDTPLIIDQPEENLDNETVAKLLVPALRYAKERRRIILVTRNPIYGGLP